MNSNPSGSFDGTQSQVKGQKKPVVNVSRQECNNSSLKINISA